MLTPDRRLGVCTKLNKLGRSAVLNPFVAMLEINVRALRKTHSIISTTRLTAYQPPVPQMVSFFRKLLGVGALAETKSYENQADLQLMMDNSVV